MSSEDEGERCDGGDADPAEKASVLRRVAHFVMREMGVAAEDLTDFGSFSRFLHTPRDPSGLAVVRILYGALMMMDVLHERGLSSADERWGDPSECRFPLFRFLRPLPLQWMVAAYALMMAGACGVALGWHFRKSCLCFLVPYWYVFLLDKSRWNNHSYLFGLLGTQMLVSGANRCWSLDGRKSPEFRNKDVPLWNYALLRGQIFLVYFIAGLKKTNLDWIGGYSMEKLGHHWVFDGFRLFLGTEQITFLVVHLGGFFLDLTVGFLMLLDSTRLLGFFFCGLFNLMNSRMFAIGMFPYVMIAVMPIFCSADWPKKLCSRLVQRMRKPPASNWSPGRSDDCVYKETSRAVRWPIDVRQRLTSLSLCCYFLVQLFLPYSHPLVPGLNGWTQGLYGYSWDMMVHSWRHVHTTLTVMDRRTGERFHLDPEAFTRSHRWSHHADMVKQLAHCLQEQMSDQHGMDDVEIYVDVWVSLNRRFTQRMYDPTVDILRAAWSPFTEVSWALPLQTQLTPWRRSLVEAEEGILRRSEDADVLFVADFPGFHLLNYVGEGQSNTTLEVMKGSIEIRFEPDRVMLLEEGETAQIPSGAYHQVSPLKHRPACYMYVYLVNRTARASDNLLQAATCPADATQLQNEDPLGGGCRGMCWGQLKGDLAKKLGILTRSLTLIGRAISSIVTQSPMGAEKGRRLPQED